MVLSPGSSIVTICVSSSVIISATILNMHCSDFVTNIGSDFVTNIEVLEMAKVTSIYRGHAPQNIQLRWAGHVSRMEDHRLPKVKLYGELSTGHRDKGAPRKRYKDTLKKSLASCNIDYRQWTIQTANRTNWRTQSTSLPLPLKSNEGPTWKTKGEGGKTGTLLK